MIDNAEITRLAEKTAPDRCFVSVYLNEGDEEWMAGRLETDDIIVEPTDLELENLDPTLEMIRGWFENNAFESSALALFACWADDFLQAVELDVPVERRLIVDSSPYVLPLAEIADEYESWCIVLADHDSARLFEVTGLEIDEVDRVAGDIKNSVKVGGWSQKRYERRREKQISDYCDEIADRLGDLDGRGGCDRIVLAGVKTLVAELEGELPRRLQDRVIGVEKLRADLAETTVFDELESVYDEAERREESELLEAIQHRRFRDGRASIGPDETLGALREGRVQTLVVDRTAELPGVRCRECERLSAGRRETCPVCDGDTFGVDLVEELVELAERTDAEIETADPTEQLSAWGQVAALLRY